MSQGWVALTSRQIAGVRRGICCERGRHVLSRSMLHSPSSSPNRFRPSGKQIFVSIKSHLSNRPVIRYKHFGTTTTDNYNNYYPYFRRTCCKMSRKREGEGDWDTWTKGHEMIWPGWCMGPAKLDQMRRTTAIMTHWKRIVALRQGGHDLADWIFAFFFALVRRFWTIANQAECGFVF